MDQLGKFVTGLKPTYDDDWVDRFNNYWTVIVIGGFAMTLNLKQYVGNPIQCWVPAQYKDAWEQYAENYCFVENTYFVPWGQNIPEDRQEREDREIAYYQWVPLVLAIEAMMFVLPHIAWRLLNWASGMNINNVLNEATSSKNIEHKSRDDAVECIANHIMDATTVQARLRRQLTQLNIALTFGKARGIYVSLLYLLIKLLYIINVVGQLFILNKFLGPQYKFWGIGILNDLAHGRPWQHSGHFPRVTLCDFDVRVLGNLHRESVQCVLQVNMFNEIAFIFLWFWFVGVAVMTIGSFLYWIPAMFAPSRRLFVNNLLIRISKRHREMNPELTAVYDINRRNDDIRLQRFVDSMSLDGVFVLRLISTNAGDSICTDIVDELYLQWAEANPGEFKDLPNLPKSIARYKREKDTEKEEKARQEKEEQKRDWILAAEMGADKALRKRVTGGLPATGIDEPDSL